MRKQLYLVGVAFLSVVGGTVALGDVSTLPNEVMSIYTFKASVSIPVVKTTNDFLSSTTRYLKGFVAASATTNYTGVLVYWTSGSNDVAYFLASGVASDRADATIAAALFGKKYTKSEARLTFNNYSSVSICETFGFVGTAFGSANSDGGIKGLSGRCTNWADVDDAMTDATRSFRYGAEVVGYGRGYGSWSLRVNRTLSNQRSPVAQRAAIVAKLPSQIKYIAQGSESVTKETWAAQ